MTPRDRKHALLLAILVLTLLAVVQGCGGGGDGYTSYSTDSAWNKRAQFSNVGTNYSPIVVDGESVRVYPTAHGADLGNLWVGSGGIGGVSDPVLALAIPGLYIRTAGIAHHEGRWYALLHVGNGYPTTIGYRPAWAESEDGLTWSYKGWVNVDGAAQSCFSSSNALIRFRGEWIGFEDCYGKKIAVIRSTDGLNWRVDAGDAWAAFPDDGAVFPSAAASADTIHLIAQSRWPGGPMRHLTSHDGRTWTVAESEVGIRSEKGANLSFSGGKLYALVNGAFYERSE